MGRLPLPSATLPTLDVGLGEKSMFLELAY